MKKNALINVVGLTKGLIGEHTPFLKAWSAAKTIATIEPILPSVTCSVQTTFLTGKMPSEHGIVGNGWYFRDECEIKFWRQSNKLVQVPSIWDLAKKKDSSFTAANMFWWYNMYSTVDFSVTPRPQYRVDGLKVPDCYSNPADLRDHLQEDLGVFPLFDFWGPRTSIKSSQWIAQASMKVLDWKKPDLILVYLPHLDYCLQKYGNDLHAISQDLKEIDEVCRDLILFLEKRGVTVNLISEYGITDVDTPIHINRILRDAGLISVREENGRELLDAGASTAFAVADHQIAHIYLQDKLKTKEVIDLLSRQSGIASVLDQKQQAQLGIGHPRSGELVAVASSNAWFTYYYWRDDAKAPDFGRTVDIHRKPGYDPVEMFVDPNITFLRPKVATKLLAKRLGFRTVMDLIPLDAALVKGSHGQTDLNDDDRGIFISDRIMDSHLKATDVQGLVLRQLFDE